MEILFLLVLAAGILALVAAAAFFWATRSGQFEDLDMNGERILHEDDADD